MQQKKRKLVDCIGDKQAKESNNRRISVMWSDPRVQLSATAQWEKVWRTSLYAFLFRFIL